MSEFKTDPAITQTAEKTNVALSESYKNRFNDIPSKFLIQMAHLTCPATVWKYVVGACTKSKANFVMLDLEDSIPRGNEEKLKEGRENVIRAYQELDWGNRLRFFRPRGLELDPGHTDIQVVVNACGDKVEGLVYPKIETADEVRSIDATLTELEKQNGIPEGQIKMEVLIESASAEEQVFEIARSSKRLVGLIFGAYDYWASLGMLPELYRADHPMVAHARARIVKAAAHVGIPAIAEMTLNYPTKEKTDEEKAEALKECRRDAEIARDYGFAGKWTGIPAQTEIALDVLSIPDHVVESAVEEAKLFLQAEKEGRGAAMIRGKMADRATDRINRVVLTQAYATGQLDEATAKELSVV